MPTQCLLHEARRAARWRLGKTGRTVRRRGRTPRLRNRFRTVLGLMARNPGMVRAVRPAVWKRFLRCTSRISLSRCRDVTCRLEAIPEVHQSDIIVPLSWRHLPFGSDSWGAPVGYHCPAVVTSLAVWKRFLRCTSRIWSSRCRDVTCRLKAIPEVHQSDMIDPLSWRHLPLGSDSWGAPVGYHSPAVVTSLAVWKRFLRRTGRIWLTRCRDVTCRLKAIPEVHQSDMIDPLSWRHLPFGSDSWGAPVGYDWPAVVTSLAVGKRFLRCTGRIWLTRCRDVTCRWEAIPEVHRSIIILLLSWRHAWTTYTSSVSDNTKLLKSPPQNPNSVYVDTKLRNDSAVEHTSLDHSNCAKAVTLI